MGSKDEATADTIEKLETIAAELGDIRRAKEYGLWRPDAIGRLDAALSCVAPFQTYAERWIFTGDGQGQSVRNLFGEWVIDFLLGGLPPGDVIAAFQAEAGRNECDYVEVLPTFGARFDRECELEPGVTLIPAADAPCWWRGRLARPFTIATHLPTEDTGYLRLDFRVRPAFEPLAAGSTAPAGASETLPGAAFRDEVRLRLRRACILAGRGPVELPASFFEPARPSPFAGGEGNLTIRPIPTYPRTAAPVESEAARIAYSRLGAFAQPEAIERATDRLGRARHAVAAADQALELGIAAEIAFMHGDRSEREDVALKIATRAAALLGSDAAERAGIFRDMKRLYNARSRAVHSGKLPSKLRVDLHDGDRLVTQALNSLLAHGRFPDWSALTVG